MSQASRRSRRDRHRRGPRHRPRARARAGRARRRRRRQRLRRLAGGRGHGGVAGRRRWSREIEAAGGRAVANGADVADFEQAAAMVQQAIDTFGGLDILVNNAGFVRDRMLVNTSEEEWDAVIRVHLKGHFAPLRHAGAYWRAEAKEGRQRAARVINTSSGAGLQGSVGQATYSAAKAGIAGLTLVAAQELGRYGVTVNAIAPVARTRMTEGAFDTSAMALPEDNSPIVAWLASEEAGDVTGRVIEIDGGKITVENGWAHGPARDLGRRWDAAEVGPGAARAARRGAGPGAGLRRAEPRSLALRLARDASPSQVLAALTGPRGSTDRSTPGRRGASESVRRVGRRCADGSRAGPPPATTGGFEPADARRLRPPRSLDGVIAAASADGSSGSTCFLVARRRRVVASAYWDGAARDAAQDGLLGHQVGHQHAGRPGSGRRRPVDRRSRVDLHRRVAGHSVASRDRAQPALRRQWPLLELESDYQRPAGAGPDGVRRGPRQQHAAGHGLGLRQRRDPDARRGHRDATGAVTASSPRSGCSARSAMEHTCDDRGRERHVGRRRSSGCQSTCPTSSEFGRCSPRTGAWDGQQAGAGRRGCARRIGESVAAAQRGATACCGGVNRRRAAARRRSEPVLPGGRRTQRRAGSAGGACRRAAARRLRWCWSTRAAQTVVRPARAPARTSRLDVQVTDAARVSLEPMATPRQRGLRSAR